MPIIEGWDEYTPSSGGGGGRFPNGTHTVQVEGAVLEDGTSAAGRDWYALDVAVTGGGTSETVRLFYPSNSEEWAAMHEVARDVLYKNLKALGISISELESETARAMLIGKTVELTVTTKGDHRNHYFQAVTQDAELPGPTQASGVPSAQTTTVSTEAIVL